MHWSFLLLDLLPLFVFVVLESLANLRYALLGALASIAFGVGYDLYVFGEIDEFTIISAGLVILFGWMALHFDNAAYFKIKPAIVNLVLAGLFLTTYIQGSPLVLVALDRYGETLPPLFQDVLSRPEVRPMLERMSLYLGFGLIAQAAAVTWAALKLSSWWWLAVRGAGFYLMIFVVGVVAR